MTYLIILSRKVQDANNDLRNILQLVHHFDITVISLNLQIKFHIFKMTIQSGSFCFEESGFLRLLMCQIRWSQKPQALMTYRAIFHFAKLVSLLSKHVYQQNMQQFHFVMTSVKFDSNLGHFKLQFYAFRFLGTTNVSKQS